MEKKLTDEQIRKIEENRKMALLKRQKASDIVSNRESNHAACMPKSGAYNFSGIQSAKKKDCTVQVSSSSISKNPPIEAVCNIISSDRFVVNMPYHSKSIEIMKSVNGRIFDQATKFWTFPINEHDVLINKLATLKPEIVVKALPRNVVNCFKVPAPEPSQINIEKIDETLLTALLPFQLDGVRFGISRKGRCLIADEMGLGKTLQALGIAHYYEDKWPLLIVCPSSMRFPWEQAIIEFLPSVNPFQIAVVTTACDDITSHKIVVISYDLLKSCNVMLKRKRFGVIIFDESHYIKNCKSARTEAAQQVATSASHVILLSGTPALSRPQELFPQLRVIDPAGFHSFHDFGLRYCDGKLKKFGWDFSGCSNSQELDLLLQRKFMIRRMKADVFEQMPSKVRKVVYLQPSMIKAVTNQMQEYAVKVVRERGLDQRSAMLEWYSATAPIKLPAVTNYIEDKLVSQKKMLIFGHHTVMLNGISAMLDEKHIDYIRIDGSTPAEQRSQLCEQFQNWPTVRVAVLSLKAANAGINLTAASLVLFAELYWNPGELTQAEDRAHRIGQNESVVVEYLVAKGTADDYMIKMVGEKLNVLNRCGLSKETFKNVETKNLPDKNQPTLAQILAKTRSVRTQDETCGKQGLDSDRTSSQIRELFSADYESLEDAFTEDDLFDAVDLATIEEEYHSESKRPRLNN